MVKEEEMTGFPFSRHRTMRVQALIEFVNANEWRAIAILLAIACLVLLMKWRSAERQVAEYQSSFYEAFTNAMKAREVGYAGNL